MLTHILKATRNYFPRTRVHQNSEVEIYWEVPFRRTPEEFAVILADILDMDAEMFYPNNYRDCIILSIPAEILLGAI